MKIDINTFKEKFNQSINQTLVSDQIVERFEHYYLYIKGEKHEENTR